MKQYTKYGSCKRKHSLNVITKNMKDYFKTEGVAVDELDDFILERITSLKNDSQEACEWGNCKELA